MYNEKMLKKSRDALFFKAATLILPLLFFSCQSAKKSGQKNLSLLFAGDIMAHTQNFSIKDYNLIWDDIRQQVEEADFSFANLESPVMESRPFESYPTFNMKSSYPAAALDAGFNLISLANNHSNDQGSEGIKATSDWAKKTATERQKTARPVFFSGIAENGEFSASEFYWNESKILFIAVTELLNTWKNYSEINYVPPTKKGRAAFVKKIAALKEAHKPDLFLVSVHTSEEEYVLTVRPEVKAFYRELLDSGADIVVSNHPHVVRPLEVFAEKETKKIRKAIIYANGNTISGQRRALNYDEPNEIWNYTGDGRFVQMELALDEKGFYALNFTSTFITAYTPQGERSPVIKRLDEKFIQTLAEKGEKKNSDYYKARLEALKKIKDILTWL